MTERRPPLPAAATDVSKEPGAPAADDHELAENDWRPTGRTLDAEGNLAGSSEGAEDGNEGGGAVAQRRAASARRRSAARADDEPLELDLRHKEFPSEAPLPTPAPEPQARPRRGLGLGYVLAALVLFGVGAAALYFFGQPGASAPGSTARTTSVLFIDSTPSGATVRVAGKVLGQTPLALDNLYQGPVDYELTLQGYRSHKGTFPGGEATRVEAKLSKR